jgi:glycine dehydrogenase
MPDVSIDPVHAPFFFARPIGSTSADQATMLAEVGYDSVDVLIYAAVGLLVIGAYHRSRGEDERAIRVTHPPGSSGGGFTAEPSPLRGAPHTAGSLVGDWDRPGSCAQAVYPAGAVANNYWPLVRRFDQSHGDSNPICSCPRPVAFAA